eukprot:1113816-Alexandrium_andersonii.AAC.1
MSACGRLELFKTEGQLSLELDASLQNNAFTVGRSPEGEGRGLERGAELKTERAIRLDPLQTPANARGRGRASFDARLVGERGRSP